MHYVDKSRLIKITLKNDEIEIVRKFANDVFNHHREMGIKRDWNVAQRTDIPSYCGEFAACKLFGRTFDKEIGGKPLPYDLILPDGTTMDVQTPGDKSIKYGNMWVKCTKKMNQADRYGLFIWEDPDAYAYKYLDASDVFQDKYLKPAIWQDRHRGKGLIIKDGIIYDFCIPIDDMKEFLPLWKSNTLIQR